MSLKFRDGAHFTALDGGSVTLALATPVDHPIPGKVVVGIKTADVDAGPRSSNRPGGREDHVGHGVGVLVGGVEAPERQRRRDQLSASRSSRVCACVSADSAVRTLFCSLSADRCASSSCASAAARSRSAAARVSSCFS